VSRPRGLLRDPVARAATARDVFEILAASLDTLSERERAVIGMRFGLIDGQPMTLDEIGKVYGVTRERIRQIEAKTMSRLRHPDHLRVLEGLAAEGLPVAVMAFLRGEVEGQRPLLRCRRHGYIDPDTVPLANRWSSLTVLPRFCPVCPCQLPRRSGGTGRPAQYCDASCRQEAYRFKQKHPRLVLTPMQVQAAARLRDEGGDIKLIAQSMEVSPTTLRRYLTKAAAGTDN
jgi:hypothetical protein